MAQTGGGHENTPDFISRCPRTEPAGAILISLLFRSALSRARQAVNFSCALAARRSSASAARPSGFPVSSQKDRLCRTASFPAPPENAELGLGSRCHLPLGAPQESRAEKGDSNHVSESHFPHRLRRQRRTTEIHQERHSGRQFFPSRPKSSWKNDKGGYDSRTEWHRCIAWGKLAEFAGKLEKGAHVQIEGELRYREYKKDRGSDANDAPVKHRLAEIHVNRILKLDRAARQEEPAPDADPGVSVEESAV